MTSPSIYIYIYVYIYIPKRWKQYKCWSHRDSFTQPLEQAFALPPIPPLQFSESPKCHELNSKICLMALRYTNSRVHCCFPQKSPVISGPVAQRDLQLKASQTSLPPCRMMFSHIEILSYYTLFLEGKKNPQSTRDSVSWVKRVLWGGYY